MVAGNIKYRKYVDILQAELVPAMGCTEPTALAYCAAKAKETLGCTPIKIIAQVSGNIIKNVKSVKIPNTNGMVGIEAAVLAGALYGDPSLGLQVISKVTEKEANALRDDIKKIDVSVVPLESTYLLDMIVKVISNDSEATVRIADSHTNIVLIEKDGKIIFEKEIEKVQENELDYDSLTVKDIFDFANTCNLDDVSFLIDRQIEYNMNIANEGLNHVYGAKIGQILLNQSNDAKTKAKAYAAAASDARMGGCDMPVIINSGSGNQGITTSVPVIVYAKEYNKSKEDLYRSLVLSNLVTLHLKSGIGRLSAYCGVVSAGAGAGAGIAYLLTKDLDSINHTIVNSIGITSGIVCDGAKSSCAAKIAFSVESGIFGFEMYQKGSELKSGEGLVSKGVENTIENINELGHDGMQQTDQKIIEIMTE